MQNNEFNAQWCINNRMQVVSGNQVHLGPRLVPHLEISGACPVWKNAKIWASKFLHISALMHWAGNMSEMCRKCVGNMQEICNKCATPGKYVTNMRGIFLHYSCIVVADQEWLWQSPYVCGPSWARLALSKLHQVISGFACFPKVRGGLR